MRTIFVLLALVSRLGMAEEIWQEWKAEGSGCGDRNVEVLKSGYYLAVIPRELGIRLEGTTRNAPVARKDCKIRVKVAPPDGAYLHSLRQVYTGGILKGPKSYAQFHVDYKLGDLKAHRIREWRYGTAIAPESDKSIWTEIVEEQAFKPKCKQKTQFHLDIRLSVFRQPQDEPVIMALDSIDIEMNPSLYLQPVFKSCQR